MSLSMEDAHQRDYQDKARIDELRRQIREFLADPPSRAHRFTVVNLESALTTLDEDSAQIVRAWD